jgi:ABC-type amino acid transport system permease subunit
MISKLHKYLKIHKISKILIKIVKNTKNSLKIIFWTKMKLNYRNISNNSNLYNKFKRTNKIIKVKII